MRLMDTDRFFKCLHLLIYWSRLQLEKYSSNGDMIMMNLNGEHLLVPLTKRARQAMQNQFFDTGKRKVLGGYILPADSWKEEYDKLHHGPCPRAIWI